MNICCVFTKIFILFKNEMILTSKNINNIYSNILNNKKSLFHLKGVGYCKSMLLVISMSS